MAQCKAPSKPPVEERAVNVIIEPVQEAASLGRATMVVPMLDAAL